MVQVRSPAFGVALPDLTLGPGRLPGFLVGDEVPLLDNGGYLGVEVFPGNRGPVGEVLGNVQRLVLELGAHGEREEGEEDSKELHLGDERDDGFKVLK